MQSASGSSAPASPRKENGVTSKNKPASKPLASRDLAKEYSFDYSKAKPNRFAAKTKPGSIAVTLDPDVAAAFGDAKSVNRILRAIVETLPR